MRRENLRVRRENLRVRRTQCEARAHNRGPFEARTPSQLDQLVFQLAFDVDLSQSCLCPPANLQELGLLLVVVLLQDVVVLLRVVVLLQDVLQLDGLLLHQLDQLLLGLLLLLHQLPEHLGLRQVCWQQPRLHHWRGSRARQVRGGRARRAARRVGIAGHGGR